jgi:hypothetical protein
MDLCGHVSSYEIRGSHSGKDFSVGLFDCDTMWILMFQKNILSLSWDLHTSPHGVTTSKTNIDVLVPII